MSRPGHRFRHHSPSPNPSASGSASLRSDRPSQDLLGYLRHEADFFPSAANYQYVIHPKPESRKWTKDQSVATASGAYGTVWKEVLQQEGDSRREAPATVRAIKQVNRSRVSNREIGNMAFLSKQSIEHFVEFYGWFESIEPSAVFLAMEWCPFGSLAERLRKPLHRADQDARDIGKQLLEGLKIMHSNNIKHRDLKPANVLIFAESPQWYVKIADFGISKQSKFSGSFAGTAGYMAPEILYDDLYDNKVDVWALGCILYQMICSTPTSTPFLDKSEMKEYYQGGHFPRNRILNAIPGNAALTASNLINGLLEPRYDDRLSAAEALEHSWFRLSYRTATSAQTSNALEARIAPTSEDKSVENVRTDWQSELSYRTGPTSLSEPGVQPGQSGSQGFGSSRLMSQAAVSQPTASSLSSIKVSLPRAATFPTSMGPAQDTGIAQNPTVSMLNEVGASVVVFSGLPLAEAKIPRCAMCGSDQGQEDIFYCFHCDQAAYHESCILTILQEPEAQHQAWHELSLWENDLVADFKEFMSNPNLELKQEPALVQSLGSSFFDDHIFHSGQPNARNISLRLQPPAHTYTVAVRIEIEQTKGLWDRLSFTKRWKLKENTFSLQLAFRCIKQASTSSLVRDAQSTSPWSMGSTFNFKPQEVAAAKEPLCLSGILTSEQPITIPSGEILELRLSLDYDKKIFSDFEPLSFCIGAIIFEKQSPRVRIGTREQIQESMRRKMEEQQAQLEHDAKKRERQQNDLRMSRALGHAVSAFQPITRTAHVSSPPPPSIYVDYEEHHTIWFCDDLFLVNTTE